MKNDDIENLKDINLVLDDLYEFFTKVMLISKENVKLIKENEKDQAD